MTSSITMLIGLELVVRAVAPQQLIQLRPDIWQSDHDGFGWRQRDHIDTRVNTGERRVRLTTGEHGHRISPTSGSRASRRVLALGDSFLVGIQVEYDELFSARLERLLELKLHDRVEVVNTGVGGWGPSHYLLEARRELGRGTFDAILVVLYSGNDMDRIRVEHFPPKEPTARHRFRWPTSVTRAEVLAAFGYPLNDTLERASHAFMLARGVLWKQLMRLGLSARRLPDALLREESDSTRWSVTASVLEDLDALAGEMDIPVVFALMPSVLQVDPGLAAGYASAIGLAEGDLDLEQPSRLLGAAMQVRGLELVDLLPPIRAARSEDRGPLFGRVDTHLSPEGHAVVAEVLLPVLERALDEGREG